MAASILVNYCLPLDNKSTPPWAIIRDMFCKELSFTNAWKLLDLLLRAKIHEKLGDTVLPTLIKNASIAKALLTHHAYSLPPEKVRDWAVETIHQMYRRKSDLYFKGNVEQKDAAIWAFRVLQQLYYNPDIKYGPDHKKYSLLYL